MKARDISKDTCVQKLPIIGEFQHNLKIGDILYSAWGYDQTNIDFYQILRLVGNSIIVIRKIKSKPVERETGIDMAGYVTADKDNFMGEELVKKFNPRYGIKITSYAYASLWDGSPKYYSWYA